MDLAFEFPTRHLKTLGSYNDYSFSLAHLVDDEEYLTYYREANKYTICDNSAFELSRPLEAPEVVRAAGLLKAQEIIAPDAFGDGNQTIKSTNEFIKYLEDSGKLGKFRVMGVVQGANVPDWVNCLMHMKENKHIDVIGFSYLGCKTFAPDLTNARIAAVRLATNEGGANLRKKIHLLGMGGNPTELLVQKNVETVRSCDTSLPVVQGLNRNRLDPVQGLVGPKLSRPDNYFDMDVTEEQLSDISYNLSTMKEWAKQLSNVK